MPNSNTKTTYTKHTNGTWSWVVVDIFGVTVGYGTGALTRRSAREKAAIIKSLHREDCNKAAQAERAAMRPKKFVRFGELRRGNNGI